MTEAERHRRAKALFLDLLALPAASRAEALARECAAEPALRMEVESLLEHADATGDATGIALESGIRTRPRFATGDLFAERYRIVTELGRGATGEVYRALDTRLDVEVALKILRRSSPAAIRHLIEEVRLARQITHPAICRVYDVEEAGGDYFLTMELVDGEDLATLISRIGRLPSEKVRQIGVELCRGLAAAHANGILHRDLKPSNVMIDGAGAVRLTDFGVAALERSSDTAPLAGTPAYMAPEQLESGAAASVKTDLYAVGLILYEALAGHARDHLGKPPALVGDVDGDIEKVVLSLLATAPNERPDSAADAAAALEALAPPRAEGTRSQRKGGGIRKRFVVAAALCAVAAAVVSAYLVAQRLPRSPESGPPVVEQITAAAGISSQNAETGVAVLPIADKSETRDQGHLAEGVQDRIIERLSRIRGLRVIAEESGDGFAATDDARTIGRQLGIDFVAIGSVEGGGEGARIDLVLYDTANGNPVWKESHHYGTAPAEALAVAQDVAEELIERMDLEAGSSAPDVDERSVPDTQTYTLYLRGREHVPPFSRREFVSSVELLKQVVQKYPLYAPAYSAIATAYVTAAALRWVEPKDGYAIARRYAARAVELDGTLAEAHVAMALIAGEYDWDWAAAEASYQRARELSPGSAWMHRSYARFLSTQGRFEESLAQTREALELDPTSALMAQGAAQRFYDARDYARAAAMARIAIQLDPINPYSYPTLGFALLEDGDYEDGIRQFRQAIAIVGADASSQARLAYAFARAGDRDAARTAAAEARRLGTLDPLERALLAFAEGDEAAAVAALADAVEARAPPSIWLAVSPQLDPLRERDDFRALVAKVGLRTSVDPALRGGVHAPR